MCFSLKQCFSLKLCFSQNYVFNSLDSVHVFLMVVRRHRTDEALARGDVIESDDGMHGRGYDVVSEGVEGYAENCF